MPEDTQDNETAGVGESDPGGGPALNEIGEHDDNKEPGAYSKKTA
jgi:hypothetical protein